MTGQPEALVVTAATWVATAAGGCVALALLPRSRRGRRAVVVIALAAGVCAGGVASAGSPRPHPAAMPSLSWRTSNGADVDRAVKVRPGDCLWEITAHELGDPTAAQIAARWPDWWRANRHVIGPDPNLIRPGERLHRPGPTPRRH